MSIGPFPTFTALVAAAVLALFTHPSPARADVETCGASLRPLVAIAQQSNSSATTYAYVIRAETGRFVQGRIVADTDHGWFDWAFPMITLTQKPVTVHVRGVEMSGEDYESAPLFVAFPASTIVRHAWVAQAKTSGETFFGWDARGTVSCSPPDFGDTDPRGSPNAPAALPSAAPIALAHPTDAAVSADCEQPFIHADVVSIPPLGGQSDFSGPTYGVGVFAVAIDDSGSVLDAWTFGSSGNPKWDTAASAALKLAKFRPPVSYCRPVATTIYVVQSFRQ